MTADLPQNPDLRTLIGGIAGGVASAGLAGAAHAQQSSDPAQAAPLPPFRITKATLPHLEEGAAIIITASVVADQPPENLFDYSQTKAANVIYAQVLAKQLASRGIRVNAVAPGPFWTPLQVVGGQPPDAIPEFGADTAMGRPGQPVEIAPLYVLLASAESSYSTGQLFEATGG